MIKSQLSFLKGLFLLILYVTSVKAQTQTLEIDSLKNSLRETSNNLTKVEILLKLASNFSYYNLDTAELFLREARLIASELNNRGLIAKCLNKQGIFYLNKRQFDLADTSFRKALELYTQLSDSAGIIAAKKNYGMLYYSMERKEAIHYLEEAYAYYIKVKDWKNQAQIAKFLGGLNIAYEDSDRAIYYIQRAKDLYGSNGDSINYCETLGYIGMFYSELEVPDSAIKYFESCFELREVFDLPTNSVQYTYLGKAYREKQDNINALYYLKKALDISEVENVGAFQALVYQELGEYFLQIENYDKSIVHFEKSIELTAENEATISVRKMAHYKLSQAYEKKRNYKKALDNYKDFVVFTDSIYRLETLKEFDDNKIKYETERKEYENKILKQENLLAESKIDSQRIQVIAIALSSLLFLLLALFFFRGKQKEKKSKQILLVKNEEIANQKEEIIAQAEELKATNERLIELDGFKEEMTNMLVHDLKNPLNNIVNTPLSYSLERQVKLMRGAGRQMNNIVMNILDVYKYENTKIKLTLKNESLIQLLEASIKQVENLMLSKNLVLKKVLQGDYFVKCDTEIFERILVNLLTNAIKYSPQNADIEIKGDVEGDKLKIEIKDYGPGIAGHRIDTIFRKYHQVNARKAGVARSTGIGLTFCKMAIEAHGGQIGLNSNVGIGTEFWVTIPLLVKDDGILRNIDIAEKNEVKKLQKDNADFNGIEKYVKELKKLNIFEVSRIKEVLGTIDTNSDVAIKEWVKQVEEAVFNCNSERYNELLNQSGV